MTTPVITIDGPGGAGKGTVSRAVATHLGWHYLDSGVLYRLAGLAASRAGLQSAAGPQLAEMVSRLDIEFVVSGHREPAVLLDKEDVTAAIRSEKAGEAASRVAQVPEVRTALGGLQREFCKPPGLVADGRDMGTVIFPDAGLKIYLTASASERAQRRHKQLKDKGIGGSLAALLEDITRRDRRDSERKVAPLRPAFDAVCIDTTGVAVDVVIGQVLALAGQVYGVKSTL